MKLLLYKNARYRRCAVVDKQGLLFRYFEDFFCENNLKGDVYFGKITRIEPNLNAVFVDYGENRGGFLSLFSIHPKYFNLPKQDIDDILKKLEKEPHLKKSPIYRKLNIRNLLKVGQKMMVQVIRNEKDRKGVMLSTFITIKGRYFKYIPNSIVSKLIVCDGVEENQLDFLEEKVEPLVENKGSLSVFHSFGISDKELLNDLHKILHIWNSIKNSKDDAGKILYREDSFFNMINENLRNVNSIIIEGNFDVKSLKINQDKFEIQSGFNIFKDFEQQVDEISMENIQLNCGGYLIFEKTQCCTTIDVNLGKNLSGKGIKKSIMETNLEAIIEIFRQINLRNVGGMILVDFIGTRNEQDMQKIEEKIEELKGFEENKIDSIEITKFGTVEICRQYANYDISFAQQCGHCGQGKVPKLYVIAEKLLRELSYIAEEFDTIDVKISKEISEFLMNHAQDDIMILKKNLLVQINFIICTEVDENFYEIDNLDEERN